MCKWMFLLLLSLFTMASNGQNPKDEFKTRIDRLTESQPDSAIDLINQLIKIAEKSNNEENLAWAYKRKGTIFMNLSDNYRAIDYYFKALKLYEQNQDSAGIAGINLNFGNVADGNEEKIVYYRKSINGFREIENTIGVIKGLINIGTTYMELNELDSAQSYFDNTYTLSKKVNYQDAISSSLLNLSVIYNKKGDIPLAISTLKQVLTFEHSEQNLMAKTYCHYNLSQFYLNLFQYDSAEYYVNQTLNLTQLNFPNIRQYCFLTLESIAASRKNYSKALEYHLQSDSLIKSMNVVSNERLLKRMEAEYRAKEEEAKIEGIQSKIKRSNYIHALLISLLVLFLFFVLLIIKYQRDKLKKARILMKYEQNIAKNEKDLLESNLKKSELEEKETRVKLKFSKSELVRFALGLVRTQEVASDINDTMDRLFKESEDRSEKKELLKFKETVTKLTKLDLGRKLFYQKALDIHNELLQNIKHRFPDLTDKDVYLLILVMLNLNYKEIASIYNIKASSVVLKRYHLRKKLQLQKGESFEAFIRSNIAYS